MKYKRCMVSVIVLSSIIFSANAAFAATNTPAVQIELEALVAKLYNMTLGTATPYWLKQDREDLVRQVKMREIQVISTLRGDISDTYASCFLPYTYSKMKNYKSIEESWLDCLGLGIDRVKAAKARNYLDENSSIFDF